MMCDDAHMHAMKCRNKMVPRENSSVYNYSMVSYRILYYIILNYTKHAPLSPLGRSLCLSCLIPVCNTTAFSRYVPIANLFTPSFDGTGRLTTRIDYSFARIATKSLYSIRNAPHNNTTLSRRNPKDAQWCRVVCRSGLEGPG